MSEFIYRISRKKTCWETELIEINADSQEEADLLAAKALMYEHDYIVLDSETNEYEDMEQTTEDSLISELYSDDNIIMTNNINLKKGYSKFEEAIAKRKELDNVPKAEIEW